MGDVEQAQFVVEARSGGYSTVPEVVVDAGYLGIQQRQATGLVSYDGDFALAVVLRDVHIRQALGGKRSGDAVDVEGYDVFLHPFAVQFRVASAFHGIEAAQGPLAGAGQRSRAAGSVHQVQIGYLLGAAVLETLGRQRSQQFGDFRFGVVGGALLPVAHQPLPQFPGEVVDVFGV